MPEFTYDVTMFKHTFEQEYTYINGFLRNVHRYANRPALTDPFRKKSWTYADLNKDVNKLAHALLADDVQKNEVVMYQLMNSAEFIFCYLAPQKIRAVNCTINFKLSPGETAAIIDDSKPAVFIYDAEIKDMVGKALTMADHNPRRIVMVDLSGEVEVPEGHIKFDEYVANQTGRKSKG